MSRAALVDIDYLKRAYLTIGGDGVSVNRVVVVQTAVGVHIALVVRVRRVRRTEPRVTRRAEKIATALHINFSCYSALCRTLSRLSKDRPF